MYSLWYAMLMTDICLALDSLLDISPLDPYPILKGKSVTITLLWDEKKWQLKSLSNLPMSTHWLLCQDSHVGRKVSLCETLLLALGCGVGRRHCSHYRQEGLGGEGSLFLFSLHGAGLIDEEWTVRPECNSAGKEISVGIRWQIPGKPFRGTL
jgi:hypothetical protein